VFAFAGPIVGDQARDLTANFPALVAETRDAIVNANDSLLARIPEEARQAAASGLDDLVKQLQTGAADIAGQALHFVASLAAFITASILVPLLAFYILLDLDRLRDTLVRMFPQRHRDRTLLVLADIDSVVGGFVRGQLIVGAIVGILVTFLLIAFQIKYALLIGVFVGIVDMVPYVGAIAGAVPAVLLAVFEHGPIWALGLALGFALMYELEGHIIAPAIVGQRVGLSPLMVIVAVLIGAELGGIGGMFVSVPVAGIIRVLWKRFMRPQVVIPAHQEPQPQSIIIEKTERAETL
jgi:predicted PurR-regulated permease PerM